MLLIFASSVLADLQSSPFYEQFDSTWRTRWTPSEARKVIDGVEDDQLLNYRGEWDLAENVLGDHGLLVKSPAAHSAISAVFKKPVDNTDKDLVVQYEVAFQKGLECGGAYLKLFTHDGKFDSKNLKDSTPYTIMFGPDKCGSNDKVHFIFRHKNPNNGQIEEKHLDRPEPTAMKSGRTNLYTLHVSADQKVKIYINNDLKVDDSLLTRMNPPVNAPKEIDDPEDVKPETWVDIKEIPDVDAVKPDDWDEDAPKNIPDEDAVKPSDWLEDEEPNIPDPNGSKPDDWDDEEDGEFSPILVPNPKCDSVSGCGIWERPMKTNPNYKGKWIRPKIPNPEYIGEWNPRKIPNPAAEIEDLKPSNFSPIGAIGFEIWSMQDGLVFDNIYVGHSIKDAKEAAKLWEAKNEIESKREAEEDAKRKSEEKPKLSSNKYVAMAQEVFYQGKDVVLKSIDEMYVFIDAAKVDPIGAVKQMPNVAVLIASLITLPILLIGLIFPGGEKNAEKSDDPIQETAESKTDQQEEVDGDDEEEDSDEKPVKKRTPRKGKK